MESYNMQSLVSGFFHSEQYPWSSSKFFEMSIAHSFLLLSSIPLCDCTSLLIHSPADGNRLDCFSFFELFQRKLQWRLVLSFYEHTLPVILGEYSGLESLDYLVVGYLSIFKTANHFPRKLCCLHSQQQWMNVSISLCHQYLLWTVF